MRAIPGKNRSSGYLLSLSYEGYQFPDRKAELLALIDEGWPGQVFPMGRYYWRI
jgi:hypothetical protein